MKLTTLLESLATVPETCNVDITKVTADSRKVEPGTLFIAQKGVLKSSFDGHSFLREAQAKGARAVIVDDEASNIPLLDIPVIAVQNSARIAAQVFERFLGSPSAHLKVTGITGTNGKSSVTFLLSGILTNAGFKNAVIGTLGAGALDDLKSTGLTTPSAEALSALFKDFAKQHFSHICMEASSHALHSYRLDGVHFETAAFTNLSEDHLDYHGDMQSYRRSKERLFLELLPPGKPAVLPYNDPLVSSLRHSHRVIEWLPCQSTAQAQRDHLVSANVHDMTAGGTHLTLTIGHEAIRFRTPLFGTFHIDNAVVAAALAHAQGIGIEAVAKALEKPPAIPGRLECISTGNASDGPSVFVDFAHTPDGLLRALQALRPLTRNRLIVVFGCGGDRDKQKRPLMGAIAAAHADLVILTNDNPRSEKPEHIIDDIIAGITKQSHVECVVDRRLAIKRALEQARLGDVVLVAGKGHELTLDIGNQKIPFYDPNVIRDILKEFLGCSHFRSLS
jgi:UDP-N-acetylmuramoyl-L-alanyl-D-glutamate--2,6-diaminopimelate ligase